MTLSITYAIATGRFRELMEARHRPVLDAVTRAFAEAEGDLKTGGRSRIAAAGFSKKWQNALRVDRYPRRGGSVGPALFLHHKIDFANIFEEGGTIRGKPLLWLPLSTAPKKIGRSRMNPRNFARLVGPLVSMRGGRKPLLGAQVRLNRSQALRERPSPSLAALKRGASGSGVLRTVPIFVGINAANIRARFRIAEVAESVRDSLPQLYVKYFRDSDGG